MTRRIAWEPEIEEYPTLIRVALSCAAPERGEHVARHRAVMA
jgi:hypothetical protein